MSLSASVRSRLKYQHETIHDLLKEFFSAQLKLRIQKDKWSAHEQVPRRATCLSLCEARSRFSIFIPAGGRYQQL